ncbi:hypothetical protein [Methylovirgula sp. 4M-Z18]|uniref:hypothetical protein n=1 Tax=Methylovirgula sp. 4M-Z18 TaxID=2293567 RepID=UPI000E2ED1F7|nr:hypothetical protein [Methylovirgula sp. 4M-Z18]RFB78304.1 hypothetical protein DYH55_16260 [Methylovirgula sp. 4M-Z18]
MRRIEYAFLVAAGLVFAAMPVHAQVPPDAPQLREQLQTLYMLEISQDLCKFEISDDQQDAIGRQTDDLEKKLDMSEEDSNRLYQQLENEMKSQKAGGLCNPKGAWAKTFKDELAKLGG